MFDPFMKVFSLWQLLPLNQWSDPSQMARIGWPGGEQEMLEVVHKANSMDLQFRCPLF